MLLDLDDAYIDYSINNNEYYNTEEQNLDGPNTTTVPSKVETETEDDNNKKEEN